MRRRAGSAAVLIAIAIAGCTIDSPERSEAITTRIQYGSAPQQFGDLSVPGNIDAGQVRPVVVLIHGGFWQSGYGLDLMEPLAADLTERGYIAWNIEYRRVGEPGGGYPGTLEDVGAAVDHLDALAGDHPLDLSNVTVVGHSAGGHLSLWAGTRADAVITPTLVVGQAPVADLAAAATADLGGTAVTDFMGAAPDQDPDGYAAASPAERLRGSVPQLIVQGGADTIVPEPYVADYVGLARTVGAEIEYVVVEDADHFAATSPEHELWAAVVERLPAAE
ncbi:alpha/beta hydrolase [Ruania halotolerans]|uniref:alpha/beta hydrolase n=1 Tax=Ruania halotolerans TaxID=2897773 RepID=UPI001E2A1B38|nr:alpha/beta hydrolase [Ruania halotolerans]UFU07991.1 alpha/beta hydrolase [Ruania halotolerans]